MPAGETGCCGKLCGQVLAFPLIPIFVIVVYIICSIILFTNFPLAVDIMADTGVLVDGTYDNFTRPMHAILWAILAFDLIIMFFLWSDKLTLNRVHCCKSQAKQNGEAKAVTGVCSALRFVFCGPIMANFCLLVLWALVIVMLYLCLVLTIFAAACLTVYSVCEIEDKINYDAITFLVAVAGIGPEAGSLQINATLQDGGGRPSKLTCPDNSSELRNYGISLLVLMPIMVFTQIVLLTSASTIFFMLQRVRRERVRFHKKLKKLKGDGGDGGDGGDDDDSMDLPDEPEDASSTAIKQQLDTQSNQIFAELGKISQQMDSLGQQEAPLTISQLQNELAELKIVLGTQDVASHRPGRTRVRRSTKSVMSEPDNRFNTAPTNGSSRQSLDENVSVQVSAD